MSRSLWLAVVTLAAAGGAAAQENPARVPFLDAVNPPAAEGGEENPFEERFETDRDAFTPTPKLVGRGRLGVESAYSFIDNRDVRNTQSYPELLLRYGLTRRVELRLGWNYEVGGESATVSGSAGGLEEFETVTRETTVSYGAKFLLAEQRDWLPESSLILAGRTPTSGPEAATQFSGTYVVGWELENRWKVDAAVRCATAESEGDKYHIWSPSAVVRVPVGERATAHAEYFGFLSAGGSDDAYRHFFSAGVSYLITPDLEVGVRGGPGLNTDTAKWFVNAGFGWRF